MLLPEYIFECSWEVCNKVGGIYTVLSSKAFTQQRKFADKLIFIGPDLVNSPADFIEDQSLFEDLKKSLPDTLQIKTGRWSIPGEPVVVLVSFKSFFDRRDFILYEMWDMFKVDSLFGDDSYVEACMFACSTGVFIEQFYHFYNLNHCKVVALFHEWMLGMGALYLHKQIPAIATIFTTHATTTGRSIAGNYKPLYSHLTAYDGCQMARELHIVAKHSLEKQTALHVDCFTTVSEITTSECTQLLGKTPDVVTPNGFEKGFVPEGEVYTHKRLEARSLLLKVVSKLTGCPLQPDTFLIATSGRYEFRNKGLDVFIDTMNLLRTSDSLPRDTVAFILVPAWVHAARADLKYCVDNDYQSDKALQTPFLTHWIHNMDDDRVTNLILSSGFTNTASDRLKIVFAPCYLDSLDGIFNKSYYDLLIGMDVTVFASYYEPWGYTPLESIAFGIPTITTNLAGFGSWSQSLVSGKDIREGISVVNRTDDNYAEVIEKISEQLLMLMNAEDKAIRQKCFRLAEHFEWEKFISYYYTAFDWALSLKL